MKNFFISLSLVIYSFTISAQTAATWHTDINKAIEVSKKENKPLLLFFTGSDWCGWCIRLQKEVFRTPEFNAWAKEKAVLVELDFPRRVPQTDAIKLQNNGLQQIFNVRGYPTVWFAKVKFSIDGKIGFEQLGSLGYIAGGSSAWTGSANQMLTKFTPYSQTELKSAKKEAEKTTKSSKKKAVKK